MQVNLPDMDPMGYDKRHVATHSEVSWPQPGYFEIQMGL